MVYYFLFLLLLPHCCEGVPQVIGSSQPIVVNVGDDVILPCHLKPPEDAAPHTIEWTRPDLKPRFVHLSRSGEEILDDQNPSYVGRTSLFMSELKNGNVSLKLSRVKVSDRGTYRCFIPTINRDTTVELLFGSVSSPSINISKSSDGVSLDCRAEGWFPEPELLWLNAKGRVLSAGPTETLRGPDGLFTVSSRLSVKKTNRDSFTCRVHQEEITQTRETHVQISADFFETCSSSSSSVVHVSIIVVLGLSLLVVAAAFIFWKWRKNQTKDTKLQQPQAERKERKNLMNNIEYLEEERRRMEEEFQKKDQDVKIFQQMVRRLEEHNKAVHKQVDKLKNLGEDTQKSVDQIEKKFETFEKTAEGNQVEGYLGVKTSILTAKKQILNEIKELNTGTRQLQYITDSLLGMMKDRKSGVESDRNEISNHQKEIQRRLSQH